MGCKILDLWIINRDVEPVMGWDWITNVGPTYGFWGVFARWGVFVAIEEDIREDLINMVRVNEEERMSRGNLEWMEGRDNIEVDDGRSMFWGESEENAREYMLGRGPIYVDGEIGNVQDSRYGVLRPLVSEKSENFVEQGVAKNLWECGEGIKDVRKEVEKLVERYGEIFGEELGCLKGYEVGFG
ncbi:unnamed protein product [Gordionus sp. m RMFG-2023]